MWVSHLIWSSIIEGKSTFFVYFLFSSTNEVVKLDVLFSGQKFGSVLETITKMAEKQKCERQMALYNAAIPAYYNKEQIKSEVLNWCTLNHSQLCAQILINV